MQTFTTHRLVKHSIDPGTPTISKAIPNYIYNTLPQEYNRKDKIHIYT